MKFILLNRLFLFFFLLSKYINIVGPRMKILWLTCLGISVFLKRNSTALYLPVGGRRVILFLCVSQQTFVDFVLCAGLGLRNIQGNCGPERLPFLVKH